MKPESALFLEKSRAFLAKAQSMLVGLWPDEAGRAAYLAGLHAARAFIFESTGEITKSHKRARAEFGRLTKDDQRFDRKRSAAALLLIGPPMCSEAGSGVSGQHYG